MHAEFEHAIRTLLSRLPAGQVTTYGDLARMAGYPGYARHVGKLLADLPEDSRLPWHRVVTASRVVSRRGTPAAALQKRLLRAENVRLNGDRVDAAHLWEP